MDSSNPDLGAVAVASASTSDWEKICELLGISDGVHLETDDEHCDRAWDKHEQQSDSCVHVQTLTDFTAEELHQDYREREHWKPVK